MLNKFTINSRFGFLAIFFLVVALSCLSIFSFSNQKNSDQLNSTVGILSKSRDSASKIEQAVQLLYAAENNSRMYALYSDNSYLYLYQAQIQQASLLIDSIGSNQQNDSSVNHLLSDKQNKTQLFISAKRLMDSLLVKSSTFKIVTPAPVTKINPYKLFHTEKADTTSTKVDVVTPKKKKFFGRLKDAINNTQESNVVEKNQLIEKQNHERQESEKEKTTLASKIVELQNRATYLNNLKRKEKAVLEANHLLFSNLLNLLAQIKSNEQNTQQIKKEAVAKDAFSLSNNLKSNNNYITLFSLLLTIIILVMLFILFRNGLALKKAKENAENYAKLKSEFTATMSHEIRTPLHSISAFAEELSENQSSSNQSEIIDAIKLSSGMLLSVVNNILDFTKLEKGKFKLAKQSFNPKALIGEILSGLKIQTKRKQLALNISIDNSLDTMLLGDAFQLRQLLLNLISNSIKYTQTGSITIHANLAQADSMKALLKLTISDTGIGIEEARLANIFDEYATTNHKTEVIEGSTGLGLSLVKKIIDLHKGKISVKSKINEGSTISIEIPYELTTAKNVDKESALKNVSKVENLNILLVENDLFNQKFLLSILKKKNAIVTLSDNAEEALKLVKENNYNLILTDISMTGMSGVELAKCIKSMSDKTKASTPIFAITGYEKDEENLDGGVAFFDEWFVKPFKAEELLSKIDEYFSK